MQEEVTIRVQRLVGVAVPFKQGGSLRITLPKRIARLYGISRSNWDDEEDCVFFFFETSVGILMCSKSDIAHNPIASGLLIAQK
ncbi:MAG: hypothetical protein KGI38_09030 [Thaumarchaeota archaeon]|nr:hypothetical protein [Nitrososphaerota archaeon]